MPVNTRNDIYDYCYTWSNFFKLGDGLLCYKTYFYVKIRSIAMFEYCK